MATKCKSPSIHWMVALSLAALVGGYFLVIRPMSQKQEALRAETVEKRAALQSLGKTLTLISDDGAKVETVRHAMADFELKLSQAGEMDKVLENVWHLAQANSLQTRTVKTPAVQNFAGYREQQMDLSLSGDFNGFYQFLLQLEESKRLVRITKMHLTRLNDHDDQVKAEMTLGVFYEPDKSVAASNGEKL